MNKRVLVTGVVLAIGAVTLTGVGVGCLSGQSSSIASDKKEKSELPVGTSVKGGDVPRLGKTPHAYQCTFGEDLVLYKDYPEDKKDSFSGLFLCRLDGGKENLREREMLDLDTGEIIDLNYDSRISVSDGEIDVAPDEEDREDTRVEKKYKAALAEEDYHFLLKKMKRYYKKKGWDLIDYRVADTIIRSMRTGKNISREILSCWRSTPYIIRAYTG